MFATTSERLRITYFRQNMRQGPRILKAHVPALWVQVMPLVSKQKYLFQQIREATCCLSAASASVHGKCMTVQYMETPGVAARPFRWKKRARLINCRCCYEAGRCPQTARFDDRHNLSPGWLPQKALQSGHSKLGPLKSDAYWPRKHTRHRRAHRAQTRHLLMLDQIWSDWA